MRGAQGTRITVSPSGRTLHIRFDPDVATAQSGDAGDQKDINLELALTRAQANAAAGYPGRARRALMQVAAGNTPTSASSGSWQTATPRRAT